MITKEQIEALGFVKIRTYPHGKYVSDEYHLGSIRIDIDYIKHEHIGTDITLEEHTFHNISLTDLKHLSRIFNK